MTIEWIVDAPACSRGTLRAASRRSRARSTSATVALLACALAVAWALPATGAVLCAKRKGAVVLREACRKKERPVGADQLVAPGPKGSPGVEGAAGAPGTPGADGAAGTPGTDAGADTAQEVRAKFFAATACPPDAVLVGTTCVDTYEASAWQVDPANTALVAAIRAGTATLAGLTAAGATQLAPASASCVPAFPATFPASGEWMPVPGSDPPSPGVYALSIAGVPPSGCATWFQASQACRASGKRLVTNVEWQGAAAGTPDPGDTPGADDCNTNSNAPSSTGSRANCRSAWGTYDMIGNVLEWTADWTDSNDACTDWTSEAGFAGDDLSCFGAPGGTGAVPIDSIPAAVVRGGHRFSGAGAGVFFVATTPVQVSVADVGFRCAR